MLQRVTMMQDFPTIDEENQWRSEKEREMLCTTSSLKILKIVTDEARLRNGGAGVLKSSTLVYPR